MILSSTFTILLHEEVDFYDAFREIVWEFRYNVVDYFERNCQDMIGCLMNSISKLIVLILLDADHE